MIIEFDKVLSTLTSSKFFWHLSKTHFSQNILVPPTDCSATSWPTGSATSWRNGKKKNDSGLVFELFQFCCWFFFGWVNVAVGTIYACGNLWNCVSENCRVERHFIVTQVEHYFVLRPSIWNMKLLFVIIIFSFTFQMLLVLMWMQRE